MKKYNILLLTLLVLLTGCNKDEGDGLLDFYVEIYVTPPGNTSRSARITDVKLSFYLSEEDFLLDQNVDFEATTPEDGFFFMEYRDIEQREYWFRAEKGDLSNLRYYYAGEREEEGIDKELHYRRGEFSENISSSVHIARTATKLQLNIISSGAPIEDAAVQLYLSEADYLAGIRPEENVEELGVSYQHVRFSDRVTGFFKATSDQNGEAYFDYLEPRDYWFRVTKGDLSNESEKITITEPLPDNPDITTSITVGIN